MDVEVGIKLTEYDTFTPIRNQGYQIYWIWYYLDLQPRPKDAKMTNIEDAEMAKSEDTKRP